MNPSQVAALYVIYGILVRSVYVYNQRIVFEDVEDERARSVLRATALLASWALCAILHFLGSRCAFHCN